jgi:osmotically-inducible protein OsmY
MARLIRLTTATLAAFCALETAAPAAHAQPQSPDTPATRADSPGDAAIADRVSAALQADPHQFYRHVTVSVTNAVVELGGSVDSSDAIFRAEDIARNTPGVAGVEDRMELERQGPNAPGH